MRYLIKNHQAVSVIVGALMLTLIAVTAATSFSLFISEQQELRQEAESASLQRELEQLSIPQIQDPAYNFQNHLLYIKFFVSSYHTQDSVISSLRINQNYVKTFNLERLDGKIEYWQVSTETGALRRGAQIAKDSVGESYLFYNVDNDDTYSVGDILVDLDYDDNGSDAQPTFGDLAEDELIYAEHHYPLKIQPQEQIKITIINILNDVYLTHKILKHNPITPTIITSLTNSFSNTFYPPVALIQLDLSSTPQLIDGTKSYTLSPNAYIVEWEWVISYSEMGEEPQPQYSPKIIYNFKPGYDYSIQLTITDNYGMKASNTYIYEA